MEMARRGSDDILSAFNTVFAGGFSSNAFQARAWRMLDAEDEIVHGQGQLLPRAVSKLQELLLSNYGPSASHTVRVAGDDGLALLQQALEERLKAGLIGEHDAVVGRALARVMVGGVGAARAMEEQAMLDLEREVFMELCATEMTRARIEHMLKTGKPLRN
jgi:3-hydroxyacyl-CoA dehydrogenase